jgi:heme-degrading monooxygenase HmoA
MAETYTSGSWTVKPGEENDFIEAWKEFVGSATDLPGSGVFRLLQDHDRRDRFTSFGEWESLEAQQAWMQLPEFTDGLSRVRSHCSDFHGWSSELVATVP